MSEIITNFVSLLKKDKNELAYLMVKGLEPQVEYKLIPCQIDLRGEKVYDEATVVEFVFEENCDAWKKGFPQETKIERKSQTIPVCSRPDELVGRLNALCRVPVVLTSLAMLTALNKKWYQPFQIDALSGCLKLEHPTLAADYSDGIKSVSLKGPVFKLLGLDSKYQKQGGRYELTSEDVGLDERNKPTTYLTRNPTWPLQTVNQEWVMWMEGKPWTNERGERLRTSNFTFLSDLEGNLKLKCYYTCEGSQSWSYFPTDCDRIYANVVRMGEPNISNEYIQIY